MLRSKPLLDEAALTAVRAWEYTPTLLNGQADAGHHDRYGAVQFEITALRLHFHQVGREVPDLRVVHDEHIAEDHVQRAAIPSGGRTVPSATTTSCSSIMRLTCIAGLPTNASFSISLSKRALSFYVKRTGYQPFDVVGQARQNFRMIGSREGIHVLPDGLFIWTHGSVFRPASGVRAS